MTRVVPETVVVKLLKARFVRLLCWMLSTNIVWAGLVLAMVFTPFDSEIAMPFPAATVSPLAPNPLIVNCPLLKVDVAPVPNMTSETVPAAYVLLSAVKAQMGRVLVNACALPVLVIERPLSVENVWALDISKPLTTIPEPAVKATVPPVLWGVRVNLSPVRLAVVLANISSLKAPGM